MVWGINELMINIKIRYNSKDHNIILDSRSLQIIIFLFLIAIIIVLGVVVVPRMLDNSNKILIKRFLSQASFDDDETNKRNTDDNSNGNKSQYYTTATPAGFKIRTNMNISPTECNNDDEDNIMEVCSEHSNISCESNMGDYQLNAAHNDYKSIKFVIDSSNVIELSNICPHLLIGWRIHVQNYGFGVITDMIKRKMRSTKFRVEFDVPVATPDSPYKKSTLDLLLYRSDKKKGLQFSAIKKVA